MQKNVAIQLRIGNASGRNILAGILKRIKDSDDCTIRIASDADDFRRLSASATALIADTSADAGTIQAATSFTPISDSEVLISAYDSGLTMLRLNDAHDVLNLQNLQNR